MATRATERNRDLQRRGICIKCKQPNPESHRRTQCRACRQEASQARRAAKLLGNTPGRGRPSTSMSVYRAIVHGVETNTTITLSAARCATLLAHYKIGPSLREEIETENEHHENQG